MSCQSNTESITDVDISEIDTKKKTVDNQDLFYKIKSWIEIQKKIIFRSVGNGRVQSETVSKNK